MELFAVAPPGIEALLERELAALGIKGRAVPGGVLGNKVGRWPAEWKGSSCDQMSMRNP